MSSPKARRRQRSTRLIVAATLVITAAVVVLGAVLSASLTFVSIAAVLGVLLGGTAARITHSELMVTRREAARDRAEQAQAYRDLTVERSIEHASFVATMETKLSRSDRVSRELEEALTSSQHRAAVASRKLGSEARRAERAEAEGTRLGRLLEESEERAGEAIVRVAELEQEVDVLTTELDAWQHASLRKHA
jgi:hypothetical protein